MFPALLARAQRLLVAGSTRRVGEVGQAARGQNYPCPLRQLPVVGDIRDEARVRHKPQMVMIPENSFMVNPYSGLYVKKFAQYRKRSASAHIDLPGSTEVLGWKRANSIMDIR